MVVSAAVFAEKVVVAVRVIDGALSIFSRIKTRSSKVEAWEFVRFLSVMSQYDLIAKSVIDCAARGAQYPDLISPGAAAEMAVLHNINDAPRFRAGISWFCHIDINDISFCTKEGVPLRFQPPRLEKLRLVNITSPYVKSVFSEETSQLLASSDECLDILCKIIVCMLAIFDHERAAYSVISVRDYEEDVRPSFYRGNAYENRFASAYDKALDKAVVSFNVDLLQTSVTNHVCDWSKVVQKVYDLMHRGH